MLLSYRCKTHFLCHTTYCECLKTITQPLSIQLIKPKIAGNINFTKIFQLCTYTNTNYPLQFVSVMLRIVKLCIGLSR